MGTDFRTAKCPSCGGDLQVPADRESVNCRYRGSSVVVAATLHAASGNVESWMELAKAALDSSNPNEAYGFYSKVLEADPRNADAWFGRAVAAGWMSTPAKLRLLDMTSGIGKAIEFAPTDNEKEGFRTAGSNALNEVGAACHGLLRQHLQEFVSLDDTWPHYLQQCSEILAALESARALQPEDQTTLKNIVQICHDNLSGVAYVDEFGERGGALVKATRHVSAEHETTLREIMADAVEGLQKLDPSYQPPLVEKASACFVATAVVGSSDHPSYTSYGHSEMKSWTAQSSVGRSCERTTGLVHQRPVSYGGRPVFASSH